MVSRTTKSGTPQPSGAAPTDRIAEAIKLVRGRRVILDTDLAALYGVAVRRLNEQVRRNRERFPDDFVIELTTEESSALRSQIATLKRGRGQHRKHRQSAFTEHGAIQAANVLNSPAAIAMGVLVVRAFVQLRELSAASTALHQRLDELELRLETRLTDHDGAIRAILSAIRELMNPKPPKRRGIGFTADLDR